MRALEYALREGWRGLRRSGTAGLLATAATGLAMLVLGSTLLVTSNIERLLARWSAVAEFSIFLRDDATSEQRGAVEAAIDQSGVALGRVYVSKAEALQRFRRDFVELADLAAGVEDNPFPASIEVRIRPDAEQDGRTARAVATLGRLAGVADVQYDRDWLTRVAALLRGVRVVGWSLAVLVALAGAATVASVVRLGLQSRYQEIEIMQLVGSPIAFIQGPFIAEGLFQGGIGACVALAVLATGFFSVRRGWADALASLLDGGDRKSTRLNSSH